MGHKHTKHNPKHVDKAVASAGRQHTTRNSDAAIQAALAQLGAGVGTTPHQDPAQQDMGQYADAQPQSGYAPPPTGPQPDYDQPMS